MTELRLILDDTLGEYLTCNRLLSLPQDIKITIIKQIKLKFKK